MPNTHPDLNLFHFKHPTDLTPVGAVSGSGPAGPLHVAVARAGLRPSRKKLRNALMDLRQQGAMPLVLLIPYAKPQPGVIFCLPADQGTAVVVDMDAEEAERIWNAALRICNAILDEPFRHAALQLLSEAIAKLG